MRLRMSCTPLGPIAFKALWYGNTTCTLSSAFATSTMVMARKFLSIRQSYPLETCGHSSSTHHNAVQFGTQLPATTTLSQTVWLALASMPCHFQGTGRTESSIPLTVRATHLNQPEKTNLPVVKSTWVWSPTVNSMSRGVFPKATKNRRIGEITTTIYIYIIKGIELLSSTHRIHVCYIW